LTIDLYQTSATGSGGVKSGVVAEGGDELTSPLSGLEDRFTCFGFNTATVEFNGKIVAHFDSPGWRG
jgi:hypothetical protein